MLEKKICIKQSTKQLKKPLQMLSCVALAENSIRIIDTNLTGMCYCGYILFLASLPFQFSHTLSLASVQIIDRVKFIFFPFKNNKF